MKYWIMRIPELMPLGETSLRAIVRAISAALPENVPGGGCVESVVTRRTHFRFAVRLVAMTLLYACSKSRRRP
jgi:hypothetical protein